MSTPSRSINSLALSITCFIVFWMSLAPLTCLANQITQQSYWEDASNEVPFNEVPNQSFTSFEGVLSKGFSHSTFWIKLTIQPLSDASSSTPVNAQQNDLILRVRPSYLDRIDLFDPMLSSTMPIQSTGDMTHWNTMKQYQSIDHNVVLSNVLHEKTIYLRLKTTSTNQIYLDCLSPGEFLISSNALSFIYSTTIAFLGFFLTWVFVNWLTDQNSLNLLFVIKQTLFLIYTFSFFGFHRVFLEDYFSPENINTFYNIWIQITILFSIWYESRFLKAHHSPRVTDLLFKLIMAWGLVNMSLIVLDITVTALFSNMLLTGVGTLLLFVTALCVKGSDSAQASKHQEMRLPKWVVVTYYTVVTGVVLIFVIPGLGLSKLPVVNLYSVISYGLSSGILMTLLLHIRTRNITKQRTADALALKASIEQIEVEKNKRKEQTDFLHMLMHELKTPLAVIDLALLNSSKSTKHQAYANRAVIDMKAIIDRCVDTDQLQEDKLTLKLESIHLLSLIEDILDTDSTSKARVDLQCKVSSNLISDFQYLRIILNNLIHNALRYGDPGEKVCIRIDHHAPTPEREHLCISILNLPGSADWPDPGKLFEKYYRSPGAQKQSGTGLGLFLVSNLCRRLGAQCTYEPTATHIQFKVCLPH